jgi:hypothetical protein
MSSAVEGGSFRNISAGGEIFLVVDCGGYAAVPDRAESDPCACRFDGFTVTQLEAGSSTSATGSWAGWAR